MMESFSLFNSYRGRLHRKKQPVHNIYIVQSVIHLSESARVNLLDGFPILKVKSICTKTSWISSQVVCSRTHLACQVTYIIKHTTYSRRLTLLKAETVLWCWGARRPRLLGSIGHIGIDQLKEPRDKRDQEVTLTASEDRREIRTEVECC